MKYWSSDVCSSDLRIYGFISHQRNLEGVAYRSADFKGTQTVGYRRLAGMAIGTCCATQPYTRSRFDHDAADGTGLLGSRPHTPEERRVGKEGVSTSRSRWSPAH